MKNISIKNSRIRGITNKTRSCAINASLFLIIISLSLFHNNCTSLRSIVKKNNSSFLKNISLVTNRFIYKDNHYNDKIDSKHRSLLEINQVYTSDQVSAIKLFLNTISSTTEKSFCIKRFVGKPKRYKSYKCPIHMKIYPDVPDVCIKDCPQGLIRGEENCEAICNKGYIREYDLCVDKINNKNYKPDFVPITKADPICINGFFSNGMCYTCLGNTEHSNGQCVSPCFFGSPSDNFCSFTDEASKNLSLINQYWARFFRSLLDELFTVVKSENVSKNIFNGFKNLKEISKYINDNKVNHDIQILCGKIMIFLRDKFKINLDDDWKTYLRSVIMKMLMRYENNDSQTKSKILAVVDDLVFFNGDYTDAYLDNKNFGLESLPATIADIFDLIC